MWPFFDNANTLCCFYLRYFTFVEYGATRMDGTHRFIDDMVKDVIADKDDLHQAVRKTNNY